MSIGMQRAITSTIEWEVRDAGHPALGNIRFAYIKRPVETRVGNLTVYSRAYLSCQKDKHSFAIELANAMAPADPGGLKPAADPRLVCHRPEDGKVLRETLLASWEINPKIGDALTRGLRAFPLRECAAITVQQELFLPEGSPQKTARVEFEILPYDRELDSIFATCGERSAYGPPPPQPPIAAARKSPAPIAAATKAAANVAAKPAPPRSTPPVPPAVAASDGGWREARTVPTGKTNVRKGPSTQTPIVASLHPGSVVRVQKTDGEWWRARPNKGAGFDGYIRQDRLVIR
jgi:hypothetical protein